MSDSIRKKSPRAPSISLDDAIDKATKIYDKEGRHAAPVDVVAKHLGYSGANNGSARAVLASLRYYGLLDRPKEGYLAVSKEFESYKFAPAESIKRNLLRKWLRTPGIFSELLDRYQERLPSDANIKFDLIQAGFSSTAADECVAVFRRSVDYARYFDDGPNQSNSEDEAGPIATTAADPALRYPTKPGAVIQAPIGVEAVRVGSDASSQGNIDRIPVRLSKGRRAWLEIPTPFFEEDKSRLKAQIDLLLTDEEESAAQGEET